MFLGKPQYTEYLICCPKRNLNILIHCSNTTIGKSGWPLLFIQLYTGDTYTLSMIFTQIPSTLITWHAANNNLGIPLTLVLYDNLLWFLHLYVLPCTDIANDFTKSLLWNHCFQTFSKNCKITPVSNEFSEISIKSACWKMGPFILLHQLLYLCKCTFK